MSLSEQINPQIAVAGGGPGEWQWSWVNFTLGEDVRDERRLMQDEKWQDAVSDGRAHVSHRECALLHKDEFIDAIMDYQLVNEIMWAFESQKSFFSVLNIEILKYIVDLALPGQGPLVYAAAEARDRARDIGRQTAKISDVSEKAQRLTDSFRICVRCRPLLNYELDAGLYNCVDLDSKRNQLIAHEGKMARNGRRLTMTHKKYQAHRIWNADASNLEVCTSEIRPLLTRAMNGYSASLICFGQTGTGKTYTLMAALEYALQELSFANMPVEVTFFELHGKKCYDLLSERKVVHLRSDENEQVRVRGARTVVASPSPSVKPFTSDSASHFAADSRPACKVAPDTAPSEEKAKAPDRSKEVHCGGEEIGDAEKQRHQQTNISPRGLSSPISAKATALTTTTTTTATTTAPATTTVSVSFEELREFLSDAIKLRSSDVTERNPISSRSHAVCVIQLLDAPTSVPPLDATNTHVPSSHPRSDRQTQRHGKGGGKLMFIDLAGSERNYETISMTASQHRESADINVSLMALKDCFRAYYAQANGQKMMHRLTRVETRSLSQHNNNAAAPVASAATNNVLVYQSRCRNPKNDLIPARAPYRASLLTRVLRECFTNCNSKTTTTTNSKSDESNIDSCTDINGESIKSCVDIDNNSGRSLSSRDNNNCGDDSVSTTDPPVSEKSDVTSVTTAQSKSSNTILNKGDISLDSTEIQGDVSTSTSTSADNRHYTTIITTVGPTPTDVQHTINSLDHVMLMSPDLHKLVTSVTVEVPMKGLALSHQPIETWTAEQVNAWLATACGGRFAQLVLPPGLDGASLINLNMVSLSALCEGQLRAARREGEGTAWVVNGAGGNRQNSLGRALWAALRMQQQQQRVAARDTTL